MNFSVILDGVCSSIIPSKDESALTWEQAVNCVLEYCEDSGYNLQKSFFSFVEENKEDYLSGNLSVILN